VERKPTESHGRPHVTPLKVYLTVGIALLILTAMTVRISFIHLGGWNVVVALLIASTKGALVALFFMHLLYDKKMYAIVFSMGLLFLSIFLALTMFDTLRRGDIYEIKTEHLKKKATIYENMPAPDSAGEEHRTHH
jgi:cytochrome c oxidase subunit 4